MPPQHLHSLNVWITSQVVDANDHRMVSIRIVQISTTGDHRPMAKTRAGASGVAGRAKLRWHSTSARTGRAICAMSTSELGSSTCLPTLGSRW